MNNLKKWLPPVAAFLLVAVLGLALLSPAEEGTAARSVGKEAPQFALSSLDGKTLSLAELKGRPVVINFWASWCGPCREEAPIFHELSTKQSQDGLVVVGVLFNENDEARARDFIAEYGLAYPNLRDDGLRTAISYGVTGIPETVFIDRDGIIQHKVSGGIAREQMNEGLGKLGVAPL